MRYSIVYSSKTGNTAQLAQRLRECLPEKETVYFGAPGGAAGEADVILAGFWTDKGTCDGDTAEFLSTLRGKKVFLFGTAGFGSDESYFGQIIGRASGFLDASNTVIGSYMCQGKMPAAVRKRYEGMLEGDPERANFFLRNFDKALTHPDDADLEGLERAVKAAVSELN